MPVPTPDERAERGRALRAVVPRSAHAELPDREGVDPVAILEAQAATRLPELVPIRHGRMLASPFAFLRGSAAVMAADLAPTPATGLRTQLCGDAHLANFGVFASPERRLVFDLNDFDETLPGPWEWDVKRLAVSLAVVTRGNGWRRGVRERAVAAAMRSYRETMRDLADRGNLAVWYASLPVEDLVERLSDQLDREALKRLDKGVAKAYRRDSLSAYRKLVEVVDGVPRIRADPPLVIPVEDVADGIAAQDAIAAIGEMIERYHASLPAERRALIEQYRLVHLARKVVGVGGVGTRAWIALLIGRDEGDPLFLQIKEARASVLEPFAGPSRYAHAGQRVAVGQRLMQAAGDILLGWEHGTGLDGVDRPAFVRQLRDWKVSLDPEGMRPEGMVSYARACGWTLARAHARTGDRIAIAAYLGRSDAFEHALVAFAEAYADRTEADHAALAEAVGAGRLQAHPGL